MRRLFESLKTRGLTQKEQEHPVWFWVITCMPALCAHFCLAGKILAEDMLRQIWQGAASWHPEQCLFADTFSFFNALLPRKEMLQGAYVFFDSLWKQFIRHGKACSDKHGFGGRHKTHLDAVVRGVSQADSSQEAGEGPYTPSIPLEQREQEASNDSFLFSFPWNP